MEKVLTISIAAYNVSKFLEKTLDSLIIDDEHMDMMEVIIVNDGSKDDTSKKAHAYADKYPNTFKVIDKENGGYGSTVNAAIEAATGKYYKLLDGDDWFDTDNLAEFIDYLEGCESDVVISPYTEEYVSDNKRIDKDDNKEVSSKVQTIEEANISDNMSMHEMCVRTSVLKDGKVELTKHCFYTDTEFVIKSLIHSKTISRYNKNIYCYRLGEEGQSVSLTGLKKHAKDAMEVTKKCSDDFSDQLNKNPGEAKKNTILKKRINRVTSLAYTGLLLQDEKAECQRGLREFDSWIKENNPALYKNNEEVKRIRMMRKTGFRFIGMYKKML